MTPSTIVLLEGVPGRLVGDEETAPMTETFAPQPPQGRVDHLLFPLERTLCVMSQPIQRAGRR
jgi:hypothetical protein